MRERLAFAERVGAFTAEHVGEPRLVVCRYGPEPLRCDLDFVTPSQLADRVEVRWSSAAYPEPDLQWLGVRRLELDAPDEARRIAATVGLRRRRCARALRAAADVYRSLRHDVQELASSRTSRRRSTRARACRTGGRAGRRSA